MCVVDTRPVPLDTGSVYFCRMGHFLQLHSLLQIPLGMIKGVKEAPCHRASAQLLHSCGVTKGHALVKHFPPDPLFAGT